MSSHEVAGHCGPAQTLQPVGLLGAFIPRSCSLSPHLGPVRFILVQSRPFGHENVAGIRLWAGGEGVFRALTVPVTPLLGSRLRQEADRGAARGKHGARDCPEAEHERVGTPGLGAGAVVQERGSVGR